MPRLLFALCVVALTVIAACAPEASTSAAPDRSANLSASSRPWPATPPMGWNSWDCFGAGVNEADTLANADYLDKNLKSHGWSIVTVDIQWYEPLAHTDRYRANAVLEMDTYGRLLPAPNRFPSTNDTRSFKPLADALHARGLKFGLHLLRGIPRQAVNQKTPILNTTYTAADIANKTDVCRWNTDMYGVDMTKPGAQQYYDSVLALMASWEIDLIKVDDLSAPNYHLAEVEAIRKAIDKTGRPIIFSTSPGATPLNQGAHVAANANMWRVSDDFWDNWTTLWEQFDRLNNWTPYRGPGHFPDADMLPIGNIRTWNANDAWTHFTHDELITLMTLWSIARSPLIIGANLPKNDDFTLSLLTNDEVIAVDQHSTNNRQLFKKDYQVAWVADVPDSHDKYLALFNAPPGPPRGRGRANQPPPPPLTPAATQPAAMTVRLADLGLANSCTVHDLWSHQDLGLINDAVSVTLNPHAAALYRISPSK